MSNGVALVVTLLSLMITSMSLLKRLQEGGDLAV